MSITYNACRYRVIRTYIKYQSFIIKKNRITYESFFPITKVCIKCHIFNNFGKTGNLSFNGLTGVNSSCSIYFTENAKKKFYQIYQIYLRLRTVKHPYPTEKGILNNFDLYGRLFKSNIFSVLTVENSRISR